VHETIKRILPFRFCTLVDFLFFSFLFAGAVALACIMLIFAPFFVILFIYIFLYCWLFAFNVRSTNWLRLNPCLTHHPTFSPSFLWSFFENLDRYLQEDFVPTEQDALRVRVKTTGISEIHFHLGNMPIQSIFPSLSPLLLIFCLNFPLFLFKKVWLTSEDSVLKEKNGFIASIMLLP